MIFSKIIIRLFSLVLSLGLLAGFSYPAMATPKSLDTLVGQVQPSVEQLDTANSTSYSKSQQNKIDKAAKDVKSLRDRLEAFQPAIKKQEWAKVHQDVAELLPDLKQKMKSVTDELELSDRILARAVSTEVFIHLEKIDEADEIYDYQAAETNYLQALQDFDAFLNLVPTS